MFSVKRLWATMVCDVRLQVRHGFYYAAAVLLLFNVAILTQLPQETVAWLLPPFLLVNLLINCFYFVGGLMLLEKAEGTLAVQIITPLRPAEYLLAKVLTLSILSLAENGVMVALVWGINGAMVWLLLGLIAAASLLTCAGLIVAVRYAGINEYLMPSLLYTTLLTAPLFPYAGAGPAWLWAWHPLHGAFTLLQAPFHPIPLWQLGLAVMSALVWITIMGWLCGRAFYEHIVVRSV
jgi:fluoroquinolone transport system permease protein